MRRNVDKNISKNLSSKHSQKLLDCAEQSATDAVKTASYQLLHYIIIQKRLQLKQKIWNPKEKYQKKICISPEERQHIYNDLKLI